ncbi:MAG: hypothetical protein C4294_03555 [Nitrospiraceae bacterium]
MARALVHKSYMLLSGKLLIRRSISAVFLPFLQYLLRFRSPLFETRPLVCILLDHPVRHGIG